MQSRSETGFTYDPLDGDQIRLLTVDRLTRESAQCQLRTYSRSLAPEYDAITYCWGEDKTLATITCNGSNLRIRKSLFRMLKYLCHRRPPYRPLWIDAICLNQDDNEEKAVEVPLIHKVFANATRTIAWLGKGNAKTDAAMNFLSSNRDVNVDDPSLTKGSSNAHQRALQAILQSPWFNRLWVLQEVIVSPEIELLYGHKSIMWPVLVSLFDICIKDHTVVQELFPETNLMEFQYSPFWGVITMNGARETFKRKHELELGLLILNFSGRGCQEPVDRIWALLGLLSTKVVTAIRQAKIIDYSDIGRREYWTSYLALMKLLYFVDVEQFKLIIFDWLETARQEDSHLPSWCPDFNAPHVIFSLSMLGKYRAGFTSPEDARDSSVTLDSSAKSLSVEGFVIDKVCRMSTIAQPFGFSMDAARARSELGWVREARAIAYKTLSKSREKKGKFCETLGVSRISGTHEGSPKDFLLCYRHHLRYLNAWSNTLPSEPDPKLSRVETISVPCADRRFFATTGSIGLGPPTMEVGDSICVFPGTGPLYVLREIHHYTQESHGVQQREYSAMPEKRLLEERYKIIGEAYVHGFMSGEAFTASSRGNMRRFTIV
jgi:hypothetical protein